MPTRDTITTVQEAKATVDKHTMTAVDTVFDGSIVRQRFPISQITPGDAEPISIDTFLAEQHFEPESEKFRSLIKLCHSQFFVDPAGFFCLRVP